MPASGSDPKSKKEITRPDDNRLLVILRKLVGDGAAEFKPEQLRVIRRIAAGKDTLAILPTGSGKSACYQVSGLYLGGLTIVVTPLIALMRDQVTRLHEAGIRVACISGGYCFDGSRSITEKSEMNRLLNRRIYLSAARGEYSFLYVTPERFKQGSFLRFANNAGISQIAVDEAHCVSLWGYDFRPNYLEIGKTLRRLERRPVVTAFTATATPSVQRDIIELLGMNAPVKKERHVTRENLNLMIEPFSSNRGRTNKLLRFIDSHADSSGIVYFYNKEKLNNVYDLLEKKGYRVAMYYSDLAGVAGSGSLKDEEYSSFVETGEKNIMLATCAFGMGVDKKDIRFVVHYDVPPSIENYYQEVGRAGRDGKPADCLMFCHSDPGKIFPAIDNSKDDVFSSGAFTEEEIGIIKKRAEVRADEMTKLCIGYFENKSTFDGSGGSVWIHNKIAEYFAGERADPSDPDADLVKINRRVLRRIDNFYANRTALAREIRAYSIKNGAGHKNISVEADPGLKGGNAGGTVSCELSESLSYFDMMIADAVYTLESYRENKIYANKIAAVLSGDPDVELKPGRKKEIEEALMRMSRVSISIRYDPKHCFCYTDEEKRGIISGPFLPLARDASGGFTWTETPPLHRYAEIMNGEFFVIPEVMFRVRLSNGEKMQTSRRNLILTYCILLRLRMLFSRGRGGKISDRVRYDYLFDRVYSGEEEPDRREKNRRMRTLRRKTDAVLASVLDRGGLGMKGYEEYCGSGISERDPVGVILR